MVKADAKQDYYGDLGLPVSADHEDIKKQFRLLAKQYHPDRNSGHEVEVVAKFQAIQAAYEILSDPTEKNRYDVARAKLARNAVPPPPKATDDPYNFRKPTRTQTAPFPQPPPAQSQPKPKQRQYPQPPETPASAGAAKFNAFTRAANNNQTWDRQRFEEAARAEAARGFAGMRSGQQTPDMPPRPPRPHPTAQRPMSSEMPNGPNPGFPGMSRTSSTRRNGYSEEPGYVPRSAYSHVRASRPPQSQQPGENWNGQSPPKVRTSGSPLRHTKSSEPSGQLRPGLFERQQSRYASTHGERTDINPGLSRSSSVRNSPVDPKWEEPDSGPFGRPRSHPPPPRHRSASPKVRTSGSAADFSSSESSEDEPIHMDSRKKAQPRVPKVRVSTADGMDTQASFSNYTRVVPEEPNGYVYPPPDPKQPTRAPFPNVSSPDAAPNDRTPFSSSQHKPDPVFRAANFKHEDWAERLRNNSTSPAKKNTRPRGKTHPSSTSVNDPDVEMGDAAASAPRGHTNGGGMNNMNDLNDAGPWRSTGLNGVDDLAAHLPFESKASNNVKAASGETYKLTIEQLPRPPKAIQAPASLEVTSETWESYTKKMRNYVYEWKCFNHKMIDHFHAREDMLEETMNPEWVSAQSDGPKRDPRPKQGGYDTYMQMLEDDRLCRKWWDQAISRHTECMEDLGRVRQVMKGSTDDSDLGSTLSA